MLKYIVSDISYKTVTQQDNTSDEKRKVNTVKSVNPDIRIPDKCSVFCRISVLSGNPDVHNPYKNPREQMCPD